MTHLMDIDPSPASEQLSLNAPHLVCVVIQNLVFGWGEWEPAGGEGRTVRRGGDALRAAGVPPGACELLSLAVPLLGPA